MLNILFKSVAQTLLGFGHNPKNGLGGKLGFIAILHTWDQKLSPHFHLHCLIPGGVVTGNGEEWKPCKNHYLFNEEALGLVFRGKFIEYMTGAYQGGTLNFPGIIAPYEKPQRFSELKSRLYSQKWVVKVQEPIKHPEYVLEYLGRYTHRVAISKHRIVALKEGMVTFTYRNRNIKQIVRITIEAVEFIRRFLHHALPKGFVRILHFGFLANRHKTDNLARFRCLLGPLPGMHEAAEHKPFGK
ncbi:MAG: transposase [Desulfobacteraceae bacterium]|nr:MAG: transposase [Desulfobacteraceae bacterium]